VLTLLLLLRREEVSVKVIFDYWFDGIPNLRYQPFRFLSGIHLSHKPSKTARSKAAGVIKALLKAGNVAEAEVGSMKDIAHRDRVFEQCFLQLFRSLYPSEDDASFDRRRIGDLSYLHVYDLLPTTDGQPAKKRKASDSGIN
jgi:hypothetical protein